MAHFWISENQLAGTATNEVPADEWPAGFTLVDGPDAPLDRLYWDGEAVQPIPPAPNDRALWDGQQWQEPIAPPPPINWAAFVDALGAEPELMGAIAQANSLFPALVSRFKDLAEGKEWKGPADNLLGLWNYSPPSLNPAQRDRLIELAEGLPISLKADGEIEVKN